LLCGCVASGFWAVPILADGVITESSGGGEKPPKRKVLECRKPQVWNRSTPHPVHGLFRYQPASLPGGGHWTGFTLWITQGSPQLPGPFLLS